MDTTNTASPTKQPNKLLVKIFSAGFFSKPSDEEVNAFASDPKIVLMGRGIDVQPNGSVYVYYRNEELGEANEWPAMPSLHDERKNMIKTLIEHRNEYIGNRLANEFNLRKYKAHEDKLLAKIKDCDQRLEVREGDEQLSGDEKHKVQMERQEIEKSLKEMVASREQVEKSIKDNDLHLALIPSIIQDVETGAFTLLR